MDSHIHRGLQLITSSSSNLKFVSSFNSLKPAANNDSSSQSILPPGGTHTFGNVLMWAARLVNNICESDVSGIKYGNDNLSIYS